jgi:hypothetical protein
MMVNKGVMNLEGQGLQVSDQDVFLLHIKPVTMTQALHAPYYELLAAVSTRSQAAAGGAGGKYSGLRPHACDHISKLLFTFMLLPSDALLASQPPPLPLLLPDNLPDSLCA